MTRNACACLVIAFLLMAVAADEASAGDPWVVHDGFTGPGNGRHWSKPIARDIRPKYGSGFCPGRAHGLHQLATSS